MLALTLMIFSRMMLLCLLTEKDADFLKKYLEDGTLNYDEAVKNNYIYVIGNGVAKELYGREFKTGEKLKFTWSDGTKKHSETFKIAGIVDKKVLESRRGVSDSRSRRVFHSSKGYSCGYDAGWV